MNPDIKEERSKVLFSVKEFADWFHGGSESLKEKRFLGKVSKLFTQFFIENGIDFSRAFSTRA